MTSTPLMPRHPHGRRLAETFAYGWKWLFTPNTSQVGWKTNEDYPLKPRTLWKKFQDMTELIGVRFGSSTRYALLDIDKDSEYLDLIPQLQGALETIGIVRTIPLRSSHSGGIHIYIPLPQSYPTFSVACALKQCLEAQGFAIAPGQLEVFPNEKAYAKTWAGEAPTEYNGHRLPLQPHSGSCLLDNDLQPMGNDLAVFWALWDNAVVCNDHAEISEALSVARANRRRRDRKATGPAEDWRQDLKAIIREGWTGPGQTNRLLKEIATYGRVFEKLSGHELYRYIVNAAESAPGFAQHCNHQHNIDYRCACWANAVEKYYWPLGDEPLRERKSFADLCKQRANDARAKLQWAVGELRDRLSGLSIKQRVQMLCEFACCSAQTLYKHRDLWHPDGNQPTEGVTPDETVDPAELERVRALVRESLESVDTPTVTPLGGENEVWILKSPDQKNLSFRDKRGGVGERKGISTGWIPSLHWKQGTVKDV